MGVANVATARAKEKNRTRNEKRNHAPHHRSYVLSASPAFVPLPTPFLFLTLAAEPMADHKAAGNAAIAAHAYDAAVASYTLALKKFRPLNPQTTEARSDLAKLYSNR